MATYPRRTTYGIFVKFRRSRLALRRGIARLEDAFSLAEQLRVGRFHDRGDIFVVKEPEGTIVELPSPPSVPEGEPPAPAQPVHDGGSAPKPPVLAKARPPAETPPPPSAAMRPKPPRSPVPARELTDLLRLVAQADHVRGAVDRARAAQARFERACEEIDHTLRSGEGAPPVELRRHHERLLALRASAARSLESFERVAILVERRLQVAWAEATGYAAPAR